MNKKGLGKGLGALISTDDDEKTGVLEIRINDIEPNKGQPRKNFNDEKLTQLSESIKQHGIVQPIIVRKEDNVYKIVAGERRWRAARLAGIKTVPVVVREITNKQVMEIALIENIQREDLNPLEEAEAFEKLLSEFHMTQEELSNTIGKSRSAIANTIRLLGLSDIVKQFLISGEISSGHARALLAVEDKSEQDELCKEIIDRSLNVRQTESLIKSYLKNDLKTNENKTESNDEQYLKIEEELQNIFGTKVKLFSKNKKGKIMIEYYSSDELERIMELINKIEK